MRSFGASHRLRSSSQHAVIVVAAVSASQCSYTFTRLATAKRFQHTPSAAAAPPTSTPAVPHSTTPAANIPTTTTPITGPTQTPSLSLPDPKNDPKVFLVGDMVWQTVAERYQLPSNAKDIKVGTAAAYRALGVVLERYQRLLRQSVVLEQTAGYVYAAADAGGMDARGPAADTPGLPVYNHPLTSAGTTSSSKTRSSSSTSLISFLVATFFRKDGPKPLETRTFSTTAAANASDASTKPSSVICEEHFPITKGFRDRVLGANFHMPVDQKKNVTAANSSTSTSTTGTTTAPTAAASTGSNNSSISSNLLLRFRRFFDDSPRLSIRLGITSSGLMGPSATSLGISKLRSAAERNQPLHEAAAANAKLVTKGGGLFGWRWVPFGRKHLLGCHADMVSTFQIAHPRDHILNAQIARIRVGDEWILWASDGISTARRKPHGAASEGSEAPDSVWVPDGSDDDPYVVMDLASYKTAMAGKITAMLETIEGRRARQMEKELEEQQQNNKESTTSTVASKDNLAATADTSSPKSADSSSAAVKPMAIAVEISLDVVIPPRRFIPDFDFYDARIVHVESDGMRMTVAKILATASATYITRLGDRLIRMFTGKPLQIVVAENPGIDMVTRNSSQYRLLRSARSSRQGGGGGGSATTGAGEDDILIGALTSSPNSSSNKGAKSSGAAAGDDHYSTADQKNAVATSGGLFDGTLNAEYPFESKLVRMVYSHADREWAIDDVVTVLQN